jgi:hypothetical protein
MVCTQDEDSLAHTPTAEATSGPVPLPVWHIIDTPSKAVYEALHPSTNAPESVMPVSASGNLERTPTLEAMSGSSVVHLPIADTLDLPAPGAREPSPATIVSEGASSTTASGSIGATSNIPLLLQNGPSQVEPIIMDVLSLPARAPSPAILMPQDEIEAAPRVFTPPPSSAAGGDVIDASSGLLASPTRDTKALGQEELSVALSSSPLTAGITMALTAATTHALTGLNTNTGASELMLRQTQLDMQASRSDDNSVGSSLPQVDGPAVITNITRQRIEEQQHDDVTTTPPPATEDRQLVCNALGLSSSAPASPTGASTTLRRTRSFNNVRTMAEGTQIIFSTAEFCTVTRSRTASRTENIIAATAQEVRSQRRAEAI